jgi:uncharacterized membrane protein
MSAAPDTPPAVCSRCGTETRATAAFCPNCGAELPLAGLNATANTEPGFRISTEAQTERSFASGALQELPENVAGMLAYFILPAIVFLLIPRYKRNRFVRFHSFQCLFTVGILFVIHVCLGIMVRFVPLIVLPIYGLLLLADLTLFLLLLVKAYQGEFFKLPIVGEWAEKRIDRDA